jgi:DNA-binding NarL/FixJ family response regulator
MTTPRRIVLLTPDLFFETRVCTAAAQLGVAMSLATPATLAAAMRDTSPARVLVDLHAPGAIDAVRAVKADAAIAAIPVTGFYSHVDDATRTAALAAGVDEALPRSTFTVRLATLLAG